MARKYAIGIDIGGTKISVTVGDRRGRIKAHRLMMTPTGRETKAGIRRLTALLKNLASQSALKNKILGIGIGIPGPVDSKSGVVPFSPNLKGWKGLKLKQILQREMRLPVVMGNDANAAALGEKYFGQGRNVSDFIYMTVSTGIGSGIVIGGELLEGKSFVAGEAGHMKIVPRGARCKCGAQGCLVAYASGTAITRRGKETLSPKAIKKILSCSGGKTLSAKAVGKAASKGNRDAIRLYEEAGYYLGIGIANLLNILNPEKIILGGGVFKSATVHFSAAMRKACKANAWPEAYKAAKIVPSNLHGYSGDLGALALVFETVKK